MSINRKCRLFQPGFTLIEVMIALMIFAVIAVSVGRSASIYINNAARLELKTKALLIAEQELNAFVLEPGFPASKTTTYDIDVGDKTWAITRKVSANPRTANFFKLIELSVAEKGTTFGKDYPIVTLTGFKGKN
ncbi:type II secretion system minor pseudopilin GspI [Litoribrevibacter albus]|uniref:Type II secretion system protein I n=1 Tax=Litoribrevibacter albus TaxID=1473156 RepID=A0AA37SBU4_9GAMM|nr:type II secretion system minor pseudopilin GspI [Litoribrevibacter albus]GLQ31834.1 hypothetical protein GCM10007876_23130 [Litoribrevibacter albus]